MTPVKLPLVPSVADYTFQCALDGDQFAFRVRWNERDSAWYFSIYDADGTLLRRNIKIVLGALLDRKIVNPLMPAGVFQAHDLSDSGLDAGFHELGDRVVVYFYPFTDFV